MKALATIITMALGLFCACGNGNAKQPESAENNKKESLMVQNKTKH